MTTDDNLGAVMDAVGSDIFVSHASEDKDAVARPLAERLRMAGLGVWYDEFSLELGDSLRASIERGLTTSRYGVVILSRSFFSKAWPQSELNGLFTKELGKRKVILPIWHEVTRDDVLRHAPMLADRVAARTSEGLDVVAGKILEVVGRRPTQPQTDRAPPSVTEVSAHQPGFSREHFRLLSTSFVETNFPINIARSGREARAKPGAVVKGESLAVAFQDSERTLEGITVWLTVQNFGQVAVRWFPPEVTAYVQDSHTELQAEPKDKTGVVLLEDIFPGEQFTFSYRFPLPPSTPTPKFLTCKSWDEPMSFSWYRGA